MTRTWTESVANTIFKLVIETKNTKFTRKKLITDHIDEIVKETGSAGKTPEQTLSRILQNLRDMGVILMNTKNKGNYVFVKHITAIDKTKRNSSKGEILLANILDEHNLRYTSQFIDTRIKNIRPLPFDFMLDFAGKKVLIEFDGEDHYQVVKRSRSELKNVANFMKRRILDKIKNRGAEEHGYELIRIRRDDVLKGSNIDKNLLEYRLIAQLCKLSENKSSTEIALE